MGNQNHHSLNHHIGIPISVTQLVIMLLASVTLVVGLNDEVDAQRFTPANTQAAGQKPLSPAEAIKRLHLPDGFQITLAASEPEVRQPIAITFDDRGRLWVAESYSYDGSTFTDDLHDRILIFEDTNGDGVLDQRRVFHDKLTHLTGLEIGFGGVWITAPPHLAFIPDRNRDDIPDSDMVVHLDGWSLKAEHNSVNGLTWGPDGWLYGRHGIKQPSHVGRPDDATSMRIELSCSIWRYHPTRCTFEVVADGTINPWGLDFDDHGQGFLSTSVVDHLWHLVPGAHYERWQGRGVHPNPFVYEAMTSTSDHLHWGQISRKQAGQNILGSTDFGGGHSHCDAMIYLGGRWPTEYHGSVFMSNIHGRRVNRDIFVRDRGPYRAVHANDFLVADDPWFRAVSMKYGPDGDVTMTDWSDNGECHDRDGVHRTSGRIYKITWGRPRYVPVNLSDASTRELVQFQLHRNEWFVRHSRRILQERSALGQDMSDAHSTLINMFHSSRDVSRKLRALWALNSIEGLNEKWLIRQLSHDSEHVRAWSVRLLVDRKEQTKDAVAAITEMAHVDRSWLVRIELAAALQKLALDQRWPTAVRLACSMADNEERNLQRMIWYAIEPVVAEHPERAVKIVESVTPAIRRWMARRVSHVAPQFLLDALERAVDPEVAADLLEGLNRGIIADNPQQLPGGAAHSISAWLKQDNIRARLAAVTAAAVVGDDSVVQQVRDLLHTPGNDMRVRLAALDGLVRRGGVDVAADLERLIVLRQLTIPTLKACAVLNDPELANTVLSHYGRLNVPERIAAIDFLIARRSSGKLLVAAIEDKKISAHDVSPGQARQLAALRDADLLKRFERLWGTARPSTVGRSQQIKEWVKKLDPSRIASANLANGRDVFKQSCGSCHKLFGEGQSIAPILTGANRRSLHYLISNVIDPSAVVPADFRLVIIALNDGRVITGTIVTSTQTLFTIQTATEVIQISKNDIERIERSAQSMMPDGLLDKLTDAQIRDLFAFMMSSGPVPATDQD